MLHLPRVLLLGGADPAWVGRLASALAGKADLVARVHSGLADLTPHRLAEAAASFIPADGPDFAVVVVAVRVGAALREEAQAPDLATPAARFKALAAALRRAAGRGAALHLALVPDGEAFERGAAGPETPAVAATVDLLAAATAAGFGSGAIAEGACTGNVLAELAAGGSRRPEPATPGTPRFPGGIEEDGAPAAAVAEALERWLHAHPPPPTCVRARYAPNPGLRAAAVATAPARPGRAGLLMIDCQNFNCHRRGALYHPGDGGGRARVPEAEADYFFLRLERHARLAWMRLLAAARASNEGADACGRDGRDVFILHTVMASQDGRLRDTALDYRASGFLLPPGCWDASPVPAAAPARGEPVLSKTTSSPFASTPLASMLRAAGVAHLYLAGCVTDQCVAATTTDAADAGFVVTLVSDACLTYSRERHEAALAALQGYARQVSSEVAAEELAVGGGWTS